jgi:hypothetical protein
VFANTDGNFTGHIKDEHDNFVAKAAGEKNPHIGTRKNN